jgi:superfamily II DNA or RNA helicase
MHLIAMDPRHTIKTMQTPRPHQVEAIGACVGGLKRPGSRGQCIMACGTGKTLVGYEVAQGLKAKRLLMLVPSLLLVNQMIREYRARGAKHILAVCSDKSTGREDAIQISVKELEADNTTDAKQAREFLDGTGQRIVVCTYQSLRSLSEVFEALEFDLAIFDEAHKTAGRKSKLFAHGLTDESVKCVRRLFMTATPRHAALKGDGSEAQVFAMNDPKVYGPVLYSLSLRAAIEAGIIDDYRIVVAVVSQQKTDDLREQAIRVAIDRAMQVYGIRKVFTFHAHVADASNFILGATETLKSARLYHVNGNQSAAERGLKLEGFRAADAALMSNARCLTEGVDLPAADMVAFLSPKKNPIDIVQAVGRVLRKHHSKAKGGYVFLPVFVRDGEDDDAAIAESDWSVVYEVLQAMREQDEPMSVQLANCARGDGELPEKIIVMDGRMRDGAGPEIDRVQFSEGIRLAIRVKLVKPFNRDPDGKKEAIIALARAGSKRPPGKTSKLGCALQSYCDQKATTHDPVFRKLLREIAPQWFADLRLESAKEALLEVAQSGEPKPRNKNRRVLAYWLSRLTAQHGKKYDCELRRRLVTLRPEWFRECCVWRTTQESALLQMAQRGEPRPKSTSREGRWLSNCLRRDAGVAALIRKTAPHWFSDPSAEKKRSLLNLAENGGRKPPSKTQLLWALTRFTLPGQEGYDPIFTEKIRRSAPGWFTSRTQQTKERLLSLARSGASKPRFPGVLGTAIWKFTSPTSTRGYDAVFADELRRLAPHWFRRTTIKEKS